MGPEPIKMEAPGWGVSRHVEDDGLRVSARYQDKDGEWKVLPTYETAVRNGHLFAGLCFVAGYAFGIVSCLIMIMYGG